MFQVHARPCFTINAMTPKDLAQDLVFLRSRGFGTSDLTRLHHFSLVGRHASLSDAIAYFEEKGSLRGNNISLADRCHYVAEQLRSNRDDLPAVIAEALVMWPLAGDRFSCAGTSRPIRKPRSVPSRIPVTRNGSGKKLGDAGEALSLALLTERGYRAELLGPNYPTYDLIVHSQVGAFFVSVKVARKRQHLRLGSRWSVERLGAGNFIFAFLARDSSEVDLESRDYKLLILPALEVRQYALKVHDEYWAAKGKVDGFSVMVKAYDLRHISQWNRWSQYEEAWGLLPRPKS
jgi:hypothetical protein